MLCTWENTSYAITGIRNGMVAIANASVVSLLSCLVSTVLAESKAVARASTALSSAILASAMASAALPSFGRFEPFGWGPGVGQRPFGGSPILVFGRPRHVTKGCLQFRQRPCHYVSADGGHATVPMYMLRVGEVLLSLVDLRNVFTWVKIRVSLIFHRNLFLQFHIIISMEYYTMGWYWFDESSDDEDNSNKYVSRENQRRKQIESYALETGDKTKPKQDGTANVVAAADQQPEYVQSLQINDDNNHDAQQSEVELDELPACLALFSKGGELDKGSAPLEGVPNGLEGDSAFLEGELGESSTTLLLGEVDEFPGGSVLLEGDELDVNLTLLEGKELGPSTPTEDDEASLPTEHVRNGPNLNRTFTVRRKVAKRILPWDLPMDEIQLAPPLPQDKDSPAKRPRLEKPFPTLEDEATTKNTAHDTTVALPPPDAAADSDPVMNMHPNAGTTGATYHWTPEEDVKLTSAVMNTRKEKRGIEYRTDWVAIAALVPGRTKSQCYNRWRSALDPSIDWANRTGAWIEDEDIKLKESVQKHGGKNWAAIAALVPGRTKTQCQHRWYALDPSVDQMAGRTGGWA
jgi:hypothetical protein